MATTRKILSKGLIKQVSSPDSEGKITAPTQDVDQVVTNEVPERPEPQENESRRTGGIRPKKACQFCSNKTEPHYFDIVALRRFINDRGRIVARVRSGSCAKHQRRITKEIKRARHLALLPFTVKV